MHSINQPRHIIRKSTAVVRNDEDRRILKTAMATFGAGALCCDGITTAGELQRLLSDGTSRISENSRVVNKSGHYGGGFGAIDARAELANHLLKMHVEGTGEPGWYSLARTMMRKGYLPDEITKLLKITRQELSKALVPQEI